ncbi:alternative oxidase, mitochondrial [Aspergillus luchuensis]|uniref:Alternative oxidase, mitochondrial n=1 Tax=Aspergillus kawachii TaxID=1069201 RepID=A0A146FNR5_ASPKA|nr:alternative oxidase, mitochondrial [Aspergillus luchuensis]
MQAKGGSSGLVQSRPQATGRDEPGGEKQRATGRSTEQQWRGLKVGVEGVKAVPTFKSVVKAKYK